MTALNDVLKAEQEADEMIETANKEAESEVLSAKAAQKDILESEKKKLEESGAEEMAAKQTKVDSLVKGVVANAEAQVIAVEKQFSEKKDAVKTALLSKFQ